jgi:tRNA_anti-like
MNLTARLVSLFILVSVLSWGLAGCSPATTPKTAGPTNPANPTNPSVQNPKDKAITPEPDRPAKKTDVTSEELAKTYAMDKKAADEKYGYQKTNKNLVIEGIVEEKDDKSTVNSLVLKGYKGEMLEVRVSATLALIDTYTAEQITKIKVGDKVKVFGAVYGPSEVDKTKPATVIVSSAVILP